MQQEKAVHLHQTWVARIHRLLLFKPLENRKKESFQFNSQSMSSINSQSVSSTLYVRFLTIFHMCQKLSNGHLID